MTDLGTVLTGFRTLLSALSGVPSAVPAHAAPYMSDDATQATLKFRIVGYQPLGLPEEQSEYDADAVIAGDTYVDPADPETPLGGIVVTVVRPVLLTVSVLIECHLSGDNYTAWPLLETLRAKLGLPSTRAAMHALGVAVSAIGPSRDVSLDWNGREVSAAQFDLTLQAFATATDEPITTIERAGLAFEATV
jgi:hypothetical protein